MAATYTIKAFPQDGGEYWIHNPAEKVLITGEPWFEKGDNINGSAEFDIYPEHPYYAYVKKLTTDITFYKDGKETFSGRVLYDDEDMAGVKHVVVEGELGYLNDSIQRPAVYHDTPPKTLCQTYIDIHNDQVENRKKFVLGLVTVEDSNDSLYRYSNYETTRESFDDKLVSRLGGHLNIRKEEENRILDYLSDDTYYKNATQTIRFGKNLLDYAKNQDATDLITCLIPLGAQQDEEEIEGLVKYLTIEDVNAGVDYVTDDAAVKEYGRIFGTNKWDDVTLPENLKAKAEEYLKGVMYENLVLELTAVDMNLTDEEIEALEVGMRVRCISEPHNIDAWYPISKMRVYLMDPGQNTFTLGVEKKNATYTSSNRQTSAELTRTIEEIPTKGDILRQAMADATDLINAAVASGYAIHEPNEFIVADDPDYKEQAKNLWRWGMGGLAHYSNGYYGVADGIALTMDGHINGKMLIANSVIAEAIDFGYTEMIESEITIMGESANEYTENLTRTVQETVTNSITNLDNRIALAVVSTKEAILQKNYVTNGETETIDLDSFTFSGTAATWEIVEHENVNCIKLTFTASGGVSIQQALGALPAGYYTVQCEAEYDTDVRAPSYIRIGFSNSYKTVYFNTFDPEYFNSVKQTYEISTSERTFYTYVYGYNGSVVYIKNLRCLQNFEELMDQITAEFSVEVDRITSDVKEIYYDAMHDYCINGDFSNTDNAFYGWSRSNSNYIVADTYDSETCAKFTGSGYYMSQTFSNPKESRVEVKLKVACASGDESRARIRVYIAGTNIYSTAGQITTEWQEMTFSVDPVAAGNVTVRIYNYVSSTTLYVTDVEILGPYMYYSEAQLVVMSDSITSEVTRATSAEETLTSRIEQLAGSITLSIEKGELGNVAQIILSVDGAEKVREQMDLGNVREAFANEDSYVLISAGTIAFASGHLVIDSYQFQLDSSGNATFSGKLSAPSGNIGGWEISSSALYHGTDSMSSTTNGTYIGSSNGFRQYNGGNYLNITSAALENGDSDKNIAELTTGILQFYHKGTLMGHYGTNYNINETSKYGMVIDSEYNAAYIGFARKTSSSASTYTYDYLINYSLSTSNIGRSEKHIFWGDVGLENALNVTGAITGSSSLSISGAATIGGNATIGGQISIASAIIIQDNGNGTHGIYSNSGGFWMMTYNTSSGRFDVGSSGQNVRLLGGDIVINGSSVNFSIASLSGTGVTIGNEDVATQKWVQDQGYLTSAEFESGDLGNYLSYDSSKKKTELAPNNGQSGTGFIEPYVEIGEDSLMTSNYSNAPFSTIHANGFRGNNLGIDASSVWSRDGDGTMAIWFLGAVLIKDGILDFDNADFMYRSDRALKKNIKTLDGSVLDEIEPVSFNWKAGKGDDKKHYGYVANDVKEVLPEIVSDREDGNMSMNYMAILPLLHAKVRALENRIKQLEGGAGA